MMFSVFPDLGTRQETLDAVKSHAAIMNYFNRLTHLQSNVWKYFMHAHTHTHITNLGMAYMGPR